MDRSLRELLVRIPKRCVLFASDAGTIDSYRSKDSQISREFLDLSKDRCVFYSRRIF